ncbi:DnaJ-like protein [Cotonvirus japonicus]|uniref:DnaJ-like protein n=1 Tax=Cotonvirus japonicus TaxID=2811091 RepID=A0ABM7NS78_9VIRU|nr:DnaJ-like protein [Cotonvirus japonicus]BCS83014.1 DnaJ-like protein [Cotonvirus japonicus]
MHTELYEILGVSSSATEADIKKAYRKLAAKHHPDKPGGDAELFKKINHANSILSDPEKRQTYDQFGEEAVNNGMGGMNDGFDPMAEFLRRHQQNSKPRFRKEHSITLEEYFTKTSVSIEIPIDNPCNDCNHTGFTDKIYHKCKTCNGNGVIVDVIRLGNMIQQRQRPCHVCEGKKFDTTSKNLHCKSCHGVGSVKSKEFVDVNIPVNILKRPITLLPGKGPRVDGQNTDLEIIFGLELSDGYKITSDGHLIYMMKINLTETLCGFKRIIDHPNGKKLLIVSERGYVINPDNLYIIDGMGFKSDLLYLSFVINYPESISIPKKKIFNFENLEMALGQRYVSNTESDLDIASEHIYILSTISKKNKSSKSDKNFDEQDEQEQEGVQGCVQQ